jgi:hypothetical protein
MNNNNKPKKYYSQSIDPKNNILIAQNVQKVPDMYDVLPNFKTQPLPLAIIIVVLIIVLIYFLYKGYNTINTSVNTDTISSIFITLFFILILLTTCITLLPSFKHIRKLFEQIESVGYVVFFTIFLIFFFRLIPNDTLNEYSAVIVPITIIIGLFAFYYALQHDPAIKKLSINYDRIKTIILMFCLITIYIIFYQVDPGGIISKYFGYTLLITILIAVFSFMYLIITITLPDDDNGNNASNLLINLTDKFNKVSLYNIILFIIFIISITITIFYFPGGFFNDIATSSVVMILMLLIFIFWSILIVSNTFPEINNKNMSLNNTSLFKRSLLILFGFIIIFLLIVFIIYNLQNLSEGTSSIISFILNLLLIITFLSFLYKTVIVQLPQNKGKSNSNTLLSYYEMLTKWFTNEKKITNHSSKIMLVAAVITSLACFIIPYIKNRIVDYFVIQGGKQLLNEPVFTDQTQVLSNYIQMNGTDNPNYQYAISFWIFIDAVPPNMNSSYEKNTSLLNYGGKPNVLYNGKTNTLTITVNQKELQNTTSKLVDFDENQHRIIYTNSNFMLQKWNNFIINYNGGILDIFMNGILVKSSIEVMPYITLDNLTIGETDGIKGGICNVIYFNKTLTATNIFYLYHSLKDKNPPIVGNS